MKYNKQLDNLIKYQLPVSSVTNKNFINCDLNESLFPLPNSILELQIEADDITRYPRNLLMLLTKKIAGYNHIHENNILLYNGSDSAIQAIFEGFCNEESKVLTFSPDYTQVETFIQLRTQKHFKFFDQFPLENEFQSEYSFDDIDLVYFSNPCNPTGKVIPKEIIIGWLSRYPNTMFIVDEAYFEFYGETLALEVNIHMNLIVTRTFSKAFGLAGLRLGYIIANEFTKSILEKFRNEKNITNIALKAGIISLQEISHLNHNLESVKSSRELFYELIDPKIISPRSHANFVLVQCNNSETVLRELQKFQISVRDRSMMINLNNCLRITLGPKELVEKIARILNVCEL